MIDVAKAKADAEEGLRIAEKATPGQIRVNRYDNEGGCISYQLQQDGPGDTVLCEFDDDENRRASCDAVFYADSRTRAPEAYRNVIEMAGVIDRLVAERNEAESKLADIGADYREEHKRIVALGVECDDLRAQATAAKLAEEKMTLKVEEHYDRAIKAEAERDEARATIAKMEPLVTAALGLVRRLDTSDEPLAIGNLRDAARDFMTP